MAGSMEIVLPKNVKDSEKVVIPHQKIIQDYLDYIEINHLVSMVFEYTNIKYSSVALIININKEWEETVCFRIQLRMPNGSTLFTYCELGTVPWISELKYKDYPKGFLCWLYDKVKEFLAELISVRDSIEKKEEIFQGKN